MTALSIRIVDLCDAPAAAAELARWFEEAWAPYYDPGGPGDARADLAAALTGRDRLPVCLVALGRHDTVVGTAALKAESVGSDVAPGPWLAALLVRPAHRRQGVATALVAAVEAEAQRLGFPALYASTDTAGALLQRRGWRTAGAATSLAGPVTVYRWQPAS